MKKKSVTTKDPLEVPAVLEFMDAHAAIQEFKEEHAKVFTEFSQLVERYNTTREAADQYVKQNGIVCGPFELHNISVKYDANKLYDAVGRDLFLQVGGIIKQETIYDIDRGRLEAAITAPNSKLTTEVVEAVRKEQVSYHKPEKLVIP